ncbi:MAG TPA: hypothetical protein EYQ60_16510 [Myxococcales bacterium]|nr:hypothetical protein [Myxococcales bacterium]HIK86565.1 hypothetical protein [Myxococcales bacterium]
MPHRAGLGVYATLNADDPFATHFLNALSSTFPYGEAFFVRSVLWYRDRIEDPGLRERIRGFAGQEGQHSRVHDDHVEMLLDQGYRFLATRNAFVDRGDGSSDLYVEERWRVISMGNGVEWLALPLWRRWIPVRHRCRLPELVSARLSS